MAAADGCWPADWPLRVARRKLGSHRAANVRVRWHRRPVWRRGDSVHARGCGELAMRARKSLGRLLGRPSGADLFRSLRERLEILAFGDLSHFSTALGFVDQDRQLLDLAAKPDFTLDDLASHAAE